MTTQTVDHEGPGERTAATAAALTAPPPRWVLPVVVGLSLLALGLRAVIGGHSGFWRDEGLFLFVVDEPSWGAMLAFLREHESHPPLFYAVTRLWFALVGDSDTTALAIPVALGAALVPAVYAVGRRLLSWRAGLLAAAMAAFSPVLVQYGAMARPYSLLPLLALAATYALIRAVDLGGRRRWAGYVGAALALAYTHNWGWLVLAAHGVALALCLGRGTLRPRATVAREAAAGLAAITVGFLPWLPSFLHQAAHAGHTPLELLKTIDNPVDAVGAGLYLGRAFLFGTFLPTTMTATGSALVVWALAVSALSVLARRRRAGAGDDREPTGLPADVRTTLTMLVAVPTVATFIAIALSIRSNLFFPYCLSTLAPLLLLLVAYGFERLRSSGQARLAVAAGAALLVGFAALLPPLYELPRSNARELARSVAGSAAPSDLILVSSGWLALSFNRYYSPATAQIDFPYQARMGPTPFDDLAERIADPGALADAETRITANRVAGHRIWLVFDPGAVTCGASGGCGSVAADPNNFADVGDLRASELRDYVTARYGAPVSCTTDLSPWDERLAACLFTPQ